MIHQRVYEYMRLMHRGKENAISMKRLAETFNTSDRDIRDIVLKINLNKILCNGYKSNTKIIGDNNGYYMAATETELNDYKNKIVARLKTSVSLYKAIINDNKENQLTFDFENEELEIIKEMNDLEKKLLTQKEMAEVLGMSDVSFRKMIKDDEGIPYIILNKQKKYKPDDVLRYLEHKTNKLKV